MKSQLKVAERTEHAVEWKQEHVSIKQWPEGDRPREKMATLGASSLTNAELIAILLRTGLRGVTAVDLARRLLKERTVTDLSAMTVSDFVSMGLGKARSATLVASFELSRRQQAALKGDMPLFISPEIVGEYYAAKLSHLKHEEFWCALLSTSKRLLREVRITSGLLDSSPIHAREAFKEAIKEASASIIFIHNHPSGNPEPSQEDINVTKQLVDAGKIIGIPVDDHVIIGGRKFVSLLEKGLI
jgi:DNA repair protein RadC